MRLTCPNCEAQYEVPDDVIPDSGRDVQCSNCGDTWFQYHPAHTPAEVEAQADDTFDTTDSWDDTAAEVSADVPPDVPVDVPDNAPAASREQPHDTSAPERIRRELDPGVQDILRDEATREAQARATERGSVEVQPDLGLGDMGQNDTGAGDDELARRSREARNRMARLRGEPDEPVPSLDDIDPASRRALLPDIEEINSSLRSSRDSTGASMTSAAYPEGDQSRGGSGFRRGFLLMVLLALLAVGIYVYAPMIAQKVPAAANGLNSYVEMVDGLRLWLDGQLRGLMLWLDSMSSSQSG